ncbi:MAG: NAD-binding protein [Deltaproteobacteria bacterium]|nr:NAD-binding protein [Deltaproteobacteria bacterium]
MALLLVFWGTGTLLFYTTHPDNLSLAQALYGAMALFGLETAVAMPKTAGFAVSAMYILYPALGLTLFASAIVRLSSLVLSKHNDEVRWVKVVASTYKNHVILCGLGQVGYRVAEQLKEFGEELIVIEKDANAPHLGAVKKLGFPVLIADAREEQILVDVGVKRAKAIVVATDNDLGNLEIALDARRIHPEIRVVLRMYDQNMAAKVAEAFKIDAAISSSAIAAPIFAGAALARGIVSAHDFDGAPHLLVEISVSPTSRLLGRTLGDLVSDFGVVIVGRSAADSPTHKKTFSAAEPIRAGEHLLAHGSKDAIRALEAAL